MNNYNELDYKEAKKHFRYDSDTGIIIYRKSGKEAGCLRPDGYRQVGVRGKFYLSHRLAWLLHYGEWPIDEVDHLNGIKTDNRIKNMRDVTHQQNHKNAPLPHINTLGIMGVFQNYPHTKWIARIGVNSRKINLGAFDNWWDAVCARKAAEHKYGFYPNHGRTQTNG